jgi:hypothetical protein
LKLIQSIENGCEIRFNFDSRASFNWFQMLAELEYSCQMRGATWCNNSFVLPFARSFAMVASPAPSPSKLMEARLLIAKSAARGAKARCGRKVNGQNQVDGKGERMSRPLQ